MFDSGYSDEDSLLDYINTLIDLERQQDAIGITKTFIERNDSWRARRWLGALYSQVGDFDEALSVLTELAEERPYDRKIIFDIAELYCDHEKFAKAIEYIDGVGSFAEEDSSLLFLKGKSLYSLDFYAKSKVALEKSLGLDPGNETTESWLAYAVNAMGKSDQEVRKDPIAPVAVPDSVFESLSEASNGYEAKGNETWYERSIVAVEFKPDALYKKTYDNTLHVHDEATLDSFKTIEIEYDPFNEEVFINTIEVRNKAGDLISSGEPEDYYVTHDANSDMATEDKVLHAPVPGLQVGSTLRYVYTRLTMGGPEKLPFERFYLTKSNATKTKAILLKAPEDSYRANATQGLTSREVDGFRVWQRSDIGAYDWEPYQPSIDDFVPMVEVSSSLKNWRTLSDEYLDRIEDRLVIEDSIRALSAEICEPAMSDREKLNAVYQFIQKNFTYKAIEFGPRGRVPNFASSIVENKYGDCKDLSLLARQLLLASGVEAQLALVNTASNVNESLPSMDQFNHAILFVPALEGGRFLDCTSRSASPLLSVPIGLGSKKALVVENANELFLEIPSATSSQNVIQSDKRIAISGEQLRVKEQLNLNGTYAAYFRSYLKSISPSQRIGELQTLMGKVDSSIQLHDFQFQHLDNSIENLILDFEYTVSNKLEPGSDGDLRLKVPSLWEIDYLDVSFLQARKHPFRIREPLLFKGTTLLDAPGFEIKLSEDDWNVSDSNEFHSYELSVEPVEEGGGQLLAHSIQRKTGRFEPAQYRSFVGSAKEALSMIGKSLRLSASGGDGNKPEL